MDFIVSVFKIVSCFMTIFLVFCMMIKNLPLVFSGRRYRVIKSFVISHFSINIRNYMYKRLII